VNSPAATIKVNGATVTSGTASQAITLNTDGTPTQVTTVVTAEDGEQKSYVIMVSKNGSSDLTVSLKLTPTATLTNTSVTPSTNTYTTSVSASTTSVTLTPTLFGATAKATVNGIAVNSGVASAAINLNTDGTPTAVTTQVTAEDGELKNYVVYISIAGGGSLAAIPARTVILPEDTTVRKQEMPLSDDVVVHQAVSPNGDGVNDVLTIDHIEAHPVNQLVILNKGGVKVYQAQGYDNSGHAFDGHSSFNSSLLQAGTYYYILDYKDKGNTVHKTGYFVLKY
jgi:gliding motility-associated-like protein